jgi:hypothetical protein
MDPVIGWLLEGDPAIRWQVRRDLLDAPEPVWRREQARVATDGWGARLLELRDTGGRWGGGLYSPKWVSTTYTLLLLYRCGLPARHPIANDGCRLLLDAGFTTNGGIDLSVTIGRPETCVTGMVATLCSWFGLDDERVDDVIGYLLQEQMEDGGWNCLREKGAAHSSFHTTIIVLEALTEYRSARHGAEAIAAAAAGREFLLQHRLYRSHRTGEVVDERMTRFSFPPRWHYDVLRALDHFRAAGAERDDRAEDAVALVLGRRRRDGRWPLQNRHAGRVHFELEPSRGPSRWNTLRALRVLRWWDEAAA